MEKVSARATMARPADLPARFTSRSRLPRAAHPAGAVPPLKYLMPALQRAAGRAPAQAEPVEPPAMETPEAQGADPPEAETPEQGAPPVPTPFVEAMREVYAELPSLSQKLDATAAEPPAETPEPVEPEKRAPLETPPEEPVEAAQALPPLSPSPEREVPGEKPDDKPAPKLGSVVADPAKETRQEFLERCRKKLKTPLAKVIEKARAVEGLWELWPDEPDAEPAEPATKKRKTEAKAAPKAKVAEPKAKAEPKAAAEPKAQAAPRRGRPGSNTDLKDRLLDGGEIETQDEYEKIPAIIRLTNLLHSRMVKAGRLVEADDALKATQKLFEASDRWADANHVSRIRRVDQKHRQNGVLFNTGMQMIKAAYHSEGELLETELRLNHRTHGS